MKKVLLILALCGGMGACTGGEAKRSADSRQAKSEVVEVLYFHGVQRCATCMAIEKNAGELIETAYAEPLKSGELVFRSVDIAEEEVLAGKYEVSWSSLILVDYDESGNERATNLTEFAFGCARTDPDKFKSGLSQRIDEMLNN